VDVIIHKRKVSEDDNVLAEQGRTKKCGTIVLIHMTNSVKVFNSDLIRG
jgi:hypothetical protein